MAQQQQQKLKDFYRRMKQAEKQLLEERKGKGKGHTIVKTELTNSTVRITLANGVTVDLSSNEGYVYMSFSGIKEITPADGSNECLLIAGGFHNHLDLPHVKLANYLNITYKPNKEE